MFRLRSDNVKLLPVDEQGLVINQALDGLDLVFTTPSHRLTVTMPLSGGCSSVYARSRIS